MPCRNNRKEAHKMAHLIGQISGCSIPEKKDKAVDGLADAMTGLDVNKAAQAPLFNQQAMSLQPTCQQPTSSVDELTDRLASIPVFQKQDQQMDGLAWGLGSADVFKEETEMDEAAYDMLGKWAPNETKEVMEGSFKNRKSRHVKGGRKK